MVSFKVVSEYTHLSDAIEGGGKIPGGPLYALARVKAIAKDGSEIFLWTRKCFRDVRELGWDADDVATLIRRLCDTDYKDSQWCENGRGAWAACDAYSVRVSEWVPTARKEMHIDYFVKFAIGKTGAVVLTVSCHT